MKRVVNKAVAGLVVLAVAAGVSGSLRAGGIEGLKAADGMAQGFQVAWENVRPLAQKAAKIQTAGQAWMALKTKGRAVWGKLPGVPNQGRYGVDHCSPYDDTMVPAPHYGEEGPHCISRNPATVICKNPRIVRELDGEMGWVDRVVGCGELLPPGGWAGTSPAPAELQAP